MLKDISPLLDPELISVLYRMGHAANKIVPLPDSLTYDQGTLVEPTTVGVHSTGRAPELKGKNILITDISDYRLEIAAKCGIMNTSNATTESLANAAKRTFGDEGFQVAFEAVGVETTMSAAVDSIEKGGNVITEPLVTKHYPFEQYADAYKFIDEQGDKTLKVMIDLD